MRVLLILLALLIPPPLTVAWEKPGVARIAWSGAGCLFHNETLYRCYSTGQTLLIGETGPIDGADRVRAGDVFVLARSDGTSERATLAWRVYFPVWRG